jgi:hypothetical protein
LRGEKEMLLMRDEGGRPIFGLKGGAFIGIYHKHLRELVLKSETELILLQPQFLKLL